MIKVTMCSETNFSYINVSLETEWNYWLCHISKVIEANSNRGSMWYHTKLKEERFDVWCLQNTSFWNMNLSSISHTIIKPDLNYKALISCEAFHLIFMWNSYMFDNNNHCRKRVCLIFLCCRQLFIVLYLQTMNLIFQLYKIFYLQMNTTVNEKGDCKPEISNAFGSF